MPPVSKKTLACRSKLPIHRTTDESPPSPSPPRRKRRAATTPEAQARKLQKEGLIPSSSKAPKVTSQSMSSSSSLLPEDPMASTTPSKSFATDSSSPMNEGNVFDKVDRMAKGSDHDDASPQGVHVVGQNQTMDKEEERGEPGTAQEQQGQGRVESEEEEEEDCKGPLSGLDSRTESPL